ncbi:MAG: mechanosensitive ion channel family protein [Pseudomonadota bacterium]
MDDLIDLPIDTSTWPDWAQAIAPDAWPTLLGVALLVLAYILGYLTKRLFRSIGRGRYESDDAFVGSSWDLAAPVIQLLVFLLAVTAGAEAIGFPFADSLADYWPRAIAGIVIIAAAVLLATWINNSLRSVGRRAHGKNRVDDTLIAFAASIIRYVVLGIAILMAMIQFGFAPGSLIAIVGAVGLAIALALQDTLKAVAAGFMIAAFRPFRIGDWVQVGGHEGEVSDITPFNTSIIQMDNKVVILSNDQVLGTAIINHTKMARRRLDLYFDVHYDTDLDHAIDVLTSIAKDHPKVLEKDQIWVGVQSLGDWSISLRFRAWIPTNEFVPVRADITKTVKQTFDKEGIEIPYPHQVEFIREAPNFKVVPDMST